MPAGGGGACTHHIQHVTHMQHTHIQTCEKKKKEKKVVGYTNESGCCIWS